MVLDPDAQLGMVSAYESYAMEMLQVRSVDK
jgi:hypothetical protein